MLCSSASRDPTATCRETTDMSNAAESTVLRIPKDRCQYLVNARPLLQSEVTEGRLINLTMEPQQDGTGEVLLSTEKETPDVTDLSRCSRFIEEATRGQASGRAAYGHVHIIGSSSAIIHARDLLLHL